MACAKKLMVPLLFLVLLANSVAAQRGGGHTLFGDFQVDESQASGLKPLSFHLILYTASGRVVERQTITSGGRYRFMRVRNGEYYVIVEMDNTEVARIDIVLTDPVRTDIRQDIFLEWRPDSRTLAKPGTVSVADFYKRSTGNEKLFAKAIEATDQKHYDAAITTFQVLLAIDPKDFQAWSELGTAYLLKESYEESEKAYLRSIAERPTSFLAHMNLGRLRSLRKNYEGAIDPLTEAVKIKPASAEANFYLGEAYLQIKKGSKAVPYLNEAAKLGRAEAHLRLATLYDAAKLKDRAAAEYQQFLQKRPDYPDRKKLEKYISENAKN